MQVSGVVVGVWEERAKRWEKPLARALWMELRKALELLGPTANPHSGVHMHKVREEAQEKEKDEDESQGYSMLDGK